MDLKVLAVVLLFCFIVGATAVQPYPRVTYPKSEYILLGGGAIAYQLPLAQNEPKVDATCTTPGPAQSLPIYGGVVFGRTGPQTYIRVSQYLVYPPDYGYYSPEGSGVIYVAGVS